MTKPKAKPSSLVEQRKSTPEGVHAFYAAKIGLRVASLLNRARDAAGLKNSDLAERLGLTEGRVSQVLNGDGNLHLATVGRFLAACGYEGELIAKPLAPNLPELARVSRGRRRPAAHAKTWDFFEQSFVSEAGVTAHVSAIPRVGAKTESCSVPVGEPKLLGTLLGTTPGVDPARDKFGFTAPRFSLDLDDWANRIDEAAAIDDIAEVSAP